MNKVFLNGYLARDPQPRVTTKGFEQSNIVVAVNDIKNSNESYFIPCVVWGASAKYINNNLKKGSFVAIDGRLTRRSYVTTDGKTNYVTEVIIDNIRNFGTRRNSEDTTTDIIAENSSDNIPYSSNETDDNIRANLDDVFATDTIKSDDGDSSEELDWDDDLN